MAHEREERLSAIRGFPSKTSHTLSALSGAAGVVLALASFVLSDLGRPHFDDPPAKFSSFYTDHNYRLQVALLAFMFATFAAVWFFGFLRWLYDGAERAARGFVRAAPIAFAGGLTGVGLAAAAGMSQLAAVELAGSVGGPVVRALDLMSVYGAVWSAVLLSVFLLSSFFIIHVTGILPAWLGVVAALGTIAGFFQAILVLAPGQDNSVFGIAGIVWYALFLLYVGAASVNLARRTETALLSG